MTAENDRILIAGAGLGGLTAALALIRRGFRVSVLEQAPALREVGAGVQIGANGMCVLDHLGLWPALEPLAWQPEGKRIYHYRTGESWPLYDLGADSVERYGFPYCMFHRADLHAVLADAVAAAQPDADPARTRALAGVEQDGARATAVLEGGERVSGAALIGADGIHSVVRRALFGPDDPQFTGIVAWRGVVPTADLPAPLLEPQSAIWIGPGGHCVHYQLRNGALMNFVGAIERGDWQRRKLEHAGHRRRMPARFRRLERYAAQPDSRDSGALQMGAACPRADGGLVEGTDHPARRRLPRHPALPRPGRQPRH